MMNEQATPNQKRTFNELPADRQRVIVWIDMRPYGGAFSEKDNAVEFIDYHFMDVDQLIESGTVWITEEEGQQNMRRYADNLRKRNER